MLFAVGKNTSCARACCVTVPSARHKPSILPIFIMLFTISSYLFLCLLKPKKEVLKSHHIG